MNDVQPSQRAKAFVKGYEKCRLIAYLPTPNDKWILGWGATGPGISAGVQWTQAQADARFEADASRYAGYVNQLIAGGAPTNQSQFDALWSFCYNVGPD